MKNSWKRRIVCVLCVATVTAGVSLVHSASLTTEDTFTPNLVMDIADDGDYLWLASDAGLVKFNKATGGRTYYSENNSDIPMDNTHSVALVDGDVWVGTAGHGIGIFNGSTWDSLTASNSGLEVDSEIRDILATPDDGIWIADGHWVCHLKDDIWESFQLFDIGYSGSTLAVVKDPSGQIWIGTHSGLYTLHDGNAELYDAVPQGGIYNIAVSSDSSLWFGYDSGNRGLYSIHNDEISFYNSDNSDIPFSNVVGIAFDQQGKQWIGGNALAVYDGTAWQEYTTENFEYLELITCIHCDDDDVVWIGTNGNGLIRFDGETWTQYDIIPGVTGIEEPSDTPSSIDLLPAYPNPFNPQTTIAYVLPETADVTLSVYSVTGQQVAVLADEYMGAGYHSAVFNGEGLASGVYLYRLETADVVKTEKMLLVK